MVAAAISGAAGGVTNALAAMGIAPESFNMSAHFLHTFAMAGVGALTSALIGVCLYLKQSPLPTANASPQAEQKRI